MWASALRVLAEQLALLQQELETAQQQAFAQTATGQALEMHAAQRGLSRKQAVYASGTAVFSREEAAPGGHPHPAGLLFDRADRQHRYATEQEAVLKAGQTQVEAPVRCQTAGSGGNVAAGRLSVMVTPVQGIAAVSNPQPILSGEDAGERPVAAPAAAGQLQTGDQRHQCGLLLQSGDELSGGLLGQGAAAGQRGEHRRVGAARAGRQ